MNEWHSEHLHLSVVGFISPPKAHTFFMGNQNNGKSLNNCKPVKSVKGSGKNPNKLMNKKLFSSAVFSSGPVAQAKLTLPLGLTLIEPHE